MSVLLSASFPSGERGERFKPNDPAGITDAVAALSRAVFKCNCKLLFGGHPTITPLVLLIAREQRVRDSVVVYQSRWFQDEVTPEVEDVCKEGFGRIEWTEKKATLQESLAQMRQSMAASSNNLSAAFFVGGMEGILEEYQVIKKLSPNALCIPIYAPGGAAADIPRPKCLTPHLTKFSESRIYPLFALNAIKELQKNMGGDVISCSGTNSALASWKRLP